MDKKIGVVTVTYNSGSVIDDFMRSLLNQTYENLIIYIIDNASTDDTIEKIKKEHADPRVIIIENKNNVGVAAGNNQGIKAALEKECEYVLLINNDTEFGIDLLQKLVSGLNGKNCDMVVPKMLYHDNPKRIWFGGGHFLRWRAYAVKHEGEASYSKDNSDTARRIEYAPTCCMLIKKEVFLDIGLMDEKYFVYYDDVDFCYRALKESVIMFYLPDGELKHKVSSLTGGGESLFSIHYSTRNKVYFIKKHIRWPFFWLLIYQLLFCIRLVSGKDKGSIFKLKQKSFFEGLNL